MSSELDGRRVLFVDAIRDDVPSGGRTATRALARRWSAHSLWTTLRIAPSVPHGESLASRLGVAVLALVHVPASIAVALQRVTRWSWLEFFSRLSPIYLLQCLWMRARTKPERVVLNHHASFVYLPLFAGLPVHLVWHDVPSRKHDSRRPRRVVRTVARCSAAIEGWALRQASAASTYSFTESSYLRRLHGRTVPVIAALDAAPASQSPILEPGRWLMVGNWSRAENADGAYELLARWARDGAPKPLSLCIAGSHADRFVADVCAEWPSLANIEARPGFATWREFAGSVLLAPIASGAGIKLKTLEAWAEGIPVVGTAQAFSGLPPQVWRLGGLRLADISEIAAFARREPAETSLALAALLPLLAYSRYRQLTVDALPFSTESVVPNAPKHQQ
jgi:hypothetical protein